MAKRINKGERRKEQDERQEKLFNRKEAKIAKKRRDRNTNVTNRARRETNYTNELGCHSEQPTGGAGLNSKTDYRLTR
jgi:hypothetical protein